MYNENKLSAIEITPPLSNQQNATAISSLHAAKGPSTPPTGVEAAVWLATHSQHSASRSEGRTRAPARHPQSHPEQARGTSRTPEGRGVTHLPDQVLLGPGRCRQADAQHDGVGG